MGRGKRLCCGGEVGELATGALLQGGQQIVKVSTAETSEWTPPKKMVLSRDLPTRPPSLTELIADMVRCLCLSLNTAALESKAFQTHLPRLSWMLEGRERSRGKRPFRF